MKPICETYCYDSDRREKNNRRNIFAAFQTNGGRCEEHSVNTTDNRKKNSIKVHVAEKYFIHLS